MIDVQLIVRPDINIESVVSASGFSAEISGMTLTTEGGSIEVVSSAGITSTLEFPASAFTIEAPASGQRCFGVWLCSLGHYHEAQDSAIYVSQFRFTKAWWVYVSAGDTDLSGAEIYRNVYPEAS